MKKNGDKNNSIRDWENDADNIISENEIRVIGAPNAEKKKRTAWWIWVIAIVGIAAAAVAVVSLLPNNKPAPEPADIQQPASDTTARQADIWLENSDASLPAATVVRDTVVDNINLQIYIPYNATPELYVGQLSTADTDIIFAAMAADLRRDNGKIVGAFVLAGEPLSWGLSKKGYCAIIDGRTTIGVADNSPLFERATENGGFFFRQYPSVHNGEMMKNNPENASFRRALCNLDGKVCIVGSTDRVLMNDFSSALAHLGVREAILLVGGSADGWYRDVDGTVTHLDHSAPIKAKYLNYIVFRKQ